MAQIGFLTPEGKLLECEYWEHMSFASELVEKMKDAPDEAKVNGLAAEEYLQKLGYIVIRARDCYGLIGYFKEGSNTCRYHMTEEQKKWLLDHYDEFVREKQESVDKLFDWDK